MAGENAAEEAAQEFVVGLLVEDQIATVVHVLHHLAGKIHAERLEGVLEGREGEKYDLDFGLHDLVVFALLRGGVQTLPGKLPAHEVEQHVA